MTYEEISTNYPIGKLLAKERICTNRTGYGCSFEDKEFYTIHYKNVRFHNDGVVEFVEETIKEYRVEGWLCTEEGFFVAENGWDGWQPLDEDDLAEIEKKGIICEF
jgi:hypothetical protein